MSTLLLPHDRHTLLEIGSSIAHRKPDFEFLNAGTLFTNTASEPFVWAARRGNAAGKKGRELASSSDWDAVPFDLLSQPFCWLTFSHCNWLCELRARISYQRETRDCCVICFTETWMSAMVPDSAHVHRSDRTKELTGKSRGGGICFYINNSWCDERNLHSIKSFCSPDLEFHMLLCRPFWLPREFTAIIIAAVYIPPQANIEQALKELYGNISEQETAHPYAVFGDTGNFNKANFRTIAPKYFQHITINTCGDRLLDQYYSPFRDGYKSLPCPPFGKSDHSSVMLLPAYRQKLKREAPALRTIQCWSDQSDAILKDCLDQVYRDMFRAASDDDIEAYSDTVTCFIRKCIEDIVQTKTIHTYVRILFVDYTLVAKLQTLGLNRSLCKWILDFLTGRSQVVRMGNNTSSPLILNTGAPQGCILSPLLYSLYTHNCTATHRSNIIVKFADDTTVIDLITDNDETAYREEVSIRSVRRTTSHSTSTRPRSW